MTGAALRVSRSHFPVTALGPGTRLGVWVQGCPLACKGCMALDTWAPDGGVAVDVDELVERWRDAVVRGATGLTVSGGEPLAQPEALLAFLEAARLVPAGPGGEYDFLVFTGYEPDELDREQRSAAACADVLVTGRYEAAQPTELIWRGSANQRMVPQSELGRRRYATIVEYRPADPAVQVRVDETGAWIVGVPRRGTLPGIDQALRDAGLAVESVSWRHSASRPQGREGRA